MNEVKFDNLRMWTTFRNGVHTLEISIESGFAEFVIAIALSQGDFEVIERDKQRAVFLHAALHDPFQLKETALNQVEQRRYLDVILHGSMHDVERFLTEKDHGIANGSISNMVRITCGREPSLMRQGHWFAA